MESGKALMEILTLGNGGTQKLMAMVSTHGKTEIGTKVNGTTV